MEVPTLDFLSKKIKKNISDAKKAEYKSDYFFKLITEEIEIKEIIIKLYGINSLKKVLLPKKRTDGKFVNKKTIGDNIYGK